MLLPAPELPASKPVGLKSMPLPVTVGALNKGGPCLLSRRRT
jgi:hypothetical protein